MKRFSCALSLSIAATFASSVHADDAAEPAEMAERAEKFFHQGTEAFEQGRFADAERALKSAWELGPSYRTAAGLGQVELAVGEYRSAAEHLDFCVRHLPSDVDPALREHVEHGLDDARGHVGALRLHVNLDGAEVTVDGQNIGHSPVDDVVFVEPGTHTVAAVRSGYTSLAQMIQAPIRTTLELTLTLVPEGAVAPAASVSKPPAPRSEASSVAISPAVLVLIVGGSLTAAALGTAIAFDLKGASAESDRSSLTEQLSHGDTSCVNPVPADVDRCAEIRDRQNTRNSANEVATAFAISTGVLAAATAVTTLLLWPHGSAGHETSAFALQGGFVRNGAALLVDGQF